MHKDMPPPPPLPLSLPLWVFGQKWLQKAQAAVVLCTLLIKVKTRVAGVLE